MTISSSLNAGVAGLAANATQLATISDNIANSSTYGYKRAEADFHSMVIDGGSGSYSAGGVRVTTNRLIDESGALVTTSNSTDLAVRGDGFLPVTTESDVGTENGEETMYLTTTGSFRTDEDGILKTESGLVLMGWPAEADGTVPDYPRDTADGLEPVQINVNQFAGEPTENISLGVNLPATETEYGGSGDSLTLPIEYYDNLGTSQSLTITYTPSVAGTVGDATNTWTMTISDSATPGEVIAAYDLVFADDRDYGGTLESVVHDAATETIDDIDATKTSSYDATTGILRVYVDGGPIDIDIGAQHDSAGMSQLSDSFAPTSISKDGSPVGNMTSVEVDANGYVIANFDIGISRVVYQIPLISMSNPNGLTSLDNQTYQISSESGSFYLWDAGDGATGDIVSYALEESSVDVANELTNLIQTQRAYSSNAKVIQTVDEMLQETTNIKR
ncbi:flagellar hook protein FlgE [Aliiruegeria sabulilitoris]|uniref:flagellar hook protein FlgE n=1 Tax=Aliiruegeria sabulilitoris TaxID=1510458 RepID=UPI00082E3CB8|nr:flagellar hook-basal body complex protein [Aliiruegeria sabulilitoris]NDR57615.1 flagellar hook-basal body complex protein [Pseudoruegeria sp. M32A2M]